MHCVHLSYLQQVSELLEDKHKSQAARLGHIAKQIREKHVVHINGQDTPKLKRCKSCQGPITSQDVRSRRKSDKIVIKCSLCGHSRTYEKARPANEPSKEQPKLS